MRNEFDLSHEHKLTTDMGYLVPCFVEEVLPGDTFIHSTSALVRIAPLANPLMHRVELRLHHWYVPNRILWAGWEDFITGKDDVTPKPSITLPASAGDKALVDHMGVYPLTGLEIDALPVRAYNLIYNEFYRDQDLQTERTTDQLGLARICWQKDYFTIARPQPQQGDAESIPVSLGSLTVRTPDVAGVTVTSMLTTAGAGNVHLPASAGGTLAERTLRAYASNGDGDLQIAIDDFRRSMALQKFAEARMRYGSRFVDYLRYLGVNPRDGRLDRPEYLGGGKEVLSFSEVLATAEGSSTDVGDMFGHGIGMGRSNTYRKMFEEHGWVLTLLSIRPKTVYQQALPRKFTRVTAMDYWQKELEVLPWQEVNQREVDANGDPATVFGYVPRFEEYRHGVSHVSGTFRQGTEEDWHLGREFASPPTLNSSFVECTPSDRVYQDTAMPECIVNTMHNIKARRLVAQKAGMTGL